MLSAGFRTFAEAANAVQRILNSGFLPSALEIADKFTLRAAREYLGESVTPRGDAHLLVEIDGHDASVKGELALLADLVRSLGCIEVEEALGEQACERFWKLRREFSYSLRNTGLIKLNEDIVVPRSRLVDLVDFAEQLQARHGFPVACFGHAGDGNIHVNIMVPTMDEPAIRERAEEALDELFHQIIAWNGAITGEHGVGIAKKRWWREAVSDATHEAHLKMKTALDPRGILNPGKFLD
jgi:FAD/FMN-containing dehydrogenase